MRELVISAALLAGGCNTIFGLDGATAIDGEVSRDVSSPTSVDLFFDRHIVIADASANLQPLDVPRPTATSADGLSTFEVIPGEEGHYTFDRVTGDAPYRVQFALPHQPVITLIGGTPLVHIHTDVVGPPGPDPIPSPSPIHVMFPTTTDVLRLVTLPVPTQIEISSMSGAIGSANFDWSAVTFLSGEPRVIRDGKAFLGHYTPVGSTPVLQLTGVSSQGISFGTASEPPAALAFTDPVHGPLACVDVTAHTASAVVMLTSAQPDTLTPKGAWTLGETPNTDVTPDGALPLAFTTMTPPTEAPVRLQIQRLDASANLVLRLETSATVTRGATHPTPLTAGGVAYQKVTAVSGCASADVRFETQYVDPLTIRIDEQDASSITVPPRGQITFDDVGANAYLVDVLEDGTAVQRYLVTDAVVPTLGLFETDHEYTIVVTSLSGLPNTRDGDFATAVYPRGKATSVSQLFAFKTP